MGACTNCCHKYGQSTYIDSTHVHIHTFQFFWELWNLTSLISVPSIFSPLKSIFVELVVAGPTWQLTGHSEEGSQPGSTLAPLLPLSLWPVAGGRVNKAFCIWETHYTMCGTGGRSGNKYRCTSEGLCKDSKQGGPLWRVAVVVQGIRQPVT